MKTGGAELKVRGWVYVITNKAMPGLVKVGFSTKDPKLRADELNHTGIPHPYIVQYDALVEHPYGIEQRVHSKLFAVREGKEWFRCSAAEAISAVRNVVGEGILLETVTEVAVEEAISSQDDQIRDEKLVVDSTATIRASHVSANSIQTTATTTKIRHTVTYAGTCLFCSNRFTVTLTRYDTGAMCPTCCRLNNVSDFMRRELGETLCQTKDLSPWKNFSSQAFRRLTPWRNS
jgi:hypothetical protein